MPQQETVKGHTVELLAEKPVTVERPKYSDAELRYLGALRARLMEARDVREKPHDIFDGLTYTQFCTENRKAANTFVKPRSNEQETTFVSGTTRQKLYFYLATVNNLDLSPDLQAFDQDNQLNVQVGETMEDIMKKVAELDSDEEKRLHRQYVLFEQGVVFSEEVWDVCRKKLKTFKKSLREYDGSVSNATWNTWEERLEKVYERPSRNLLRNESVYLGDITKYFMDDQPFIFTVELMPYAKAKAIYGMWERWKNVPFEATNEAEQDDTPYSQNWRLTELKSGMVEVVKYQDRWGDEYQILLNGVMMMPVGFPLPWRSGHYNIEKQVLEYIPNSAYGKSFPSRLKHAQALLDEMIRLAVLKTQTSFKPPRANLTGHVVSSKVFAAGTVTAGLDPRLLPVIGESTGVTPSEQNMIQMLFKEADANSVDPMQQGQGGAGDPTATEVVTLKAQAEKMLGITVFVASMLEKKLAQLRIDNIIQNFFDPVDTRANLTLKTIRNKYRSIALPKSIDGAGYGVKMIRVAEADEIPKPEDVYQEEEQLARKMGMSVRIAYVDPEVFTKVRYEWYVTIVPREKRTSEFAKLTFDQFIQRLAGLPGVNVDWAYVGKRYAEMYRENPEKVFAPGAAPTAPTEGAGQEAGTPPAVTQMRGQPSAGALKREGQL